MDDGADATYPVTMAEADRYPIPARRHRVEQTVRRSRFIATLAPANDEGSARAFIDRVRAEFPDATHNCWAYVAGPPGSTAVIGMSDDGEPHGTAGRPMLEVLLHSGVGEVAAVVTRYFGGVKLGRGGLGRAYSDVVTLALGSLPLGERVTRRRLRIEVDYSAVDGLRRLIDDHDALTESEKYGEAATYIVAVPQTLQASLEAALAALTAGRARVQVIED